MKTAFTAYILVVVLGAVLGDLQLCHIEAHLRMTHTKLP